MNRIGEELLEAVKEMVAHMRGEVEVESYEVQVSAEARHAERKQSATPQARLPKETRR